MNISVNTTSPTLSSINQVKKEKEEQDEKLASGLRINSASDDAAGLQISSRLTSQINAYEQLSSNTQDAINVNNVEEAQLSAIGEGLQRANVLSIQSGSSLNDPNAIQGELDQITEQINTIAKEAFGQDDFLTGLNASDPIATQEAIAEAYQAVSDSTAALGAESNALTSQSGTYDTTRVNVSQARSQISDTDYAQTTSEQTQTETLLQSALVNKQDEEARKGVIINQLV